MEPAVPRTMRALIKTQATVRPGARLPLLSRRPRRADDRSCPPVQASYAYVDVPVPEPVGDELLLVVERVAICGSDINLYLWNDGLYWRRLLLFAIVDAAVVCRYRPASLLPLPQLLLLFRPPPPLTAGAVGRAIAALPFTPGHECVGRVVRRGPQAQSVPLGARVCVENHFYCGSCYQCRHGAPHDARRHRRRRRTSVDRPTDRSTDRSTQICATSASA